MSAVADRIERAVNPLPDHLALVEARRENVRLNRERDAYLARVRGELAAVVFELEGCLVKVRGLMQ